MGVPIFLSLCYSRAPRKNKLKRAAPSLFFTFGVFVRLIGMHLIKLKLKSLQRPFLWSHSLFNFKLSINLLADC